MMEKYESLGLQAMELVVKDCVKKGGKMVLNQVYPLAGSQLKDGDARLMTICNQVNRNLNKL